MLSVAAALLFGSVAVSQLLAGADTFYTLVFILLAVAGLVGAAEASLSKVVLLDDTLVIHSKFGKRTYRREDFVSVTWERASPVSLKRVDGTWVKFPSTFETGQGQTSIVRAWLGPNKAHKPTGPPPLRSGGSAA